MMIDAPAHLHGSSDRYRSTGRVWALVSCVAVLALSIGFIVKWAVALHAYNADYAAATRGAVGTVVWSEGRRRSSDVIAVRWLDERGDAHRRQFSVDDAGDFPVGTTLPIRISTTDRDRIYPEDRESIDETSGLTAGITLVSLAMVTYLFLWGLRFRAWWVASRAAPSPRWARLWYANAITPQLLTGSPWLEIVDGRQTYYQREIGNPG